MGTRRARGGRSNRKGTPDSESCVQTSLGSYRGEHLQILRVSASAEQSNGVSQQMHMCDVVSELKNKN